MLAIRKGSPIDERQLKDFIKGHDAVLSTFGQADFKPSFLLRDSAVATINAMKKCGITRIVIESMAALFPGFFPTIVRFFLRNVANDSAEMEKAIENSGLEWTIARPPRLTNGPDSNYRSQASALPKGEASLSRKAVAAFMLDCLEQQKYLQKIVASQNDDWLSQAEHFLFNSFGHAFASESLGARHVR